MALLLGHELPRRSNGSIAPTRDRPGHNLVWSDAVSSSKDATNTGLIERRFSSNVAHWCHFDSQLLRQFPSNTSTRIVDQESLVRLTTFFEDDSDICGVGTFLEKLNGTRVDFKHRALAESC